MSTLRNPVGPQSPRVYWRRRLIVILGLLAVVIIVVLIVVRPGSGTPGSTPEPSTPVDPSATPSADSPSPGSTNPVDAIECDPKKVTVTAGTDAVGYDVGVIPQLSFSLKSTMTDPCVFSAGSDVQEYVITSGDEQIWSSKDCQIDAVAATTILEPGVPKAGPSIAWDRTRSSTDTCDSERPEVDAAGASYHLGVTVNGVESKETKQFLLY
jgi:hypothetical protein